MFKIVEARFKIEGRSPLLCHSGQLANPLNPVVKRMKEFTSKRKKTDSDYEQLAKLEFVGGLYYDTALGPFLPAEMIEGAIRGGAAKARQGKDVLSAVSVVEDSLPLVYDGPRTPEELFDDPNFKDCRLVTVNKAKVMRTRPMFRKWSVEGTIRINEDVINCSSIKKAIETAGVLVGLGDYRPKFGRFELVEFSRS